MQLQWILKWVVHQEWVVDFHLILVVVMQFNHQKYPKIQRLQKIQPVV
jgi:hypothetical protein